MTRKEAVACLAEHGIVANVYGYYSVMYHDGHSRPSKVFDCPLSAVEFLVAELAKED
jgi:hypothetical protein